MPAFSPARNTRPRALSAFALAGAAGLVFSAALWAEVSNAPRRYMVQFRPGSLHAAVVRDVGAAPVEEVPELGIVAAWLTDLQVERLSRNPAVMRLELDPPRYPMALSSP
jgi:hypothetical protein